MSDWLGAEFVTISSMAAQFLSDTTTEQHRRIRFPIFLKSASKAPFPRSYGVCKGFDAAATKKCFSMARKVLLTLRINYENYRKHIRYQLLPVVNRPDPSKHSENQTIMIKVKAIFAALALAALLSSSAKAAAISTDLKENSVIDGAVSTVNPEHPTVVKVVPQASGDSYISQRWVKLQSVQSGIESDLPQQRHHSDS